MLVPIVAAAAAIYGAYVWDKKRKEAALSSALSSSPAPGLAPPPQTGIQYPQAVSNADPNKVQSYVIRYQAAQPMPTGKFYQPVDGDVSTLVLVRFSGVPVGVVPSKSGKTLLTYADLGKLNGFLTPQDFNNWIKAKKPLHLPAGYQDGGARQGANGTLSG